MSQQGPGKVSWDVLVAGGGPSGLAAALYASRRGLRSIIVEPKAGPVDKACGEGLMPAAVGELAGLGVRPRGRAFVGIRYLQGRHQAQADFKAGPGLGVRRTELHRALRSAVDAAGIPVETGRVSELSQDDAGVHAAGLRARWLIAADGLRSPVRAQLGLELPARRPARLGLRRHFAIAPWTDRVEVHWSQRAEAYVTPVDDEVVGVAFLWFRDRPPEGVAGQAPFERLLAQFPALQARLDDAAPASALRGAGPFERRLRRRYSGRVLLVGDAAGYLDPLTGEGIRLGLESAQAAVCAIQLGRPALYETAWRRLARRYWWGTAGLLWLARHSLTRPMIVPVSATAPPVMAGALGVVAA